MSSPLSIQIDPDDLARRIAAALGPPRVEVAAEPVMLTEADLAERWGITQRQLAEARKADGKLHMAGRPAVALPAFVKLSRGGKVSYWCRAAPGTRTVVDVEADMRRA